MFNVLFKYYFLILLLSFIFSQELITEPSRMLIINHEIKSIKNNRIDESLFVLPYINYSKTEKKYFNLVKNLNLGKKLIIEPVFSLRIYDNGNEILSKQNSLLWITPGIKMKSIIPIVTDYTSIWLNAWTSFYKHSAIFNDYVFDSIEDRPLFQYNNHHSIGFFTKSIEPKKSIDFDQSQGGISLLSKNFELYLGRFNTSFGPSTKSNLSLSVNAPPIDQLLFKFKNDKIVFSYMIGSLDSNLPKEIPEDSIYTDKWIWKDNYQMLSNELLNTRSQEYNKYLAYHRIDIIPKENIRLGFYEQVIFGVRNIPIYYMIPVLPFWSSQHQSGDLDNLMIGFDFDYIFKKSNRIYFSLLIDEWAPYSTFKEDERNWFAYQVGFSKYFNLLTKDFLFKLEYTKIDPRVYNHRFIINESTHHSYNLGYWSGNHSDDLTFNLISQINSNSYIKLNYEFTRFGNNELFEEVSNLESQYNNQKIEFLGEEYNYRGLISLEFSTSIMNLFYLDIKLSEYNTKGLYFMDDFNDININLRYNISK